MKKKLPVLYAIFSGLITALAIPNEWLFFGSPVLGLVALVPLYLALSEARSYRQAAVLVGLQILTVHLLSSFWLAFFKGFAIFTLGASAVATMIIGMAMSGFVYFPFARTPAEYFSERNFHKNYAKRILLFALAWMLYEWIKSNGFLAYPWGTLYMTAYQAPYIMQIADITGMWGVTFLFALFSGVCAEAILLHAEHGFTKNADTPARYRALFPCAAFCALLFAGTLVYGAVQYHRERIPEKTLNALLVQQNVDPWPSEDDYDYNWETNKGVAVSMRLTEQAERQMREKVGQKPDIAVWSEGVLTQFFPAAEQYYRINPEPESLLSFIDRLDYPFIIGGAFAFSVAKRQFGNAVLQFNSDSKFEKFYAKMHLVPFAEVIPFGEYEWVQDFLQAVVGFSYAWTQGKLFELFEVPLHGKDDGKTVTFSTPICFEDAFPDVCRNLFLLGSEVFINLTNDSWSRTASAEYQHFAVASYRAIELRTTLVRSTNSGYSVVVDPSGKIIADMPLFTEASLAAEIPIYPRIFTFYALFGDWLPVLTMLFFWLCVVRQVRLTFHTLFVMVSLRLELKNKIEN